MSESAGKVICDAGPIIHLDELGCLALLDDFGEALVPGQVWREVRHHRPQALGREEVKLTRVVVDIDIQPSFHALMKSLSLDLGEQAALSLMRRNAEATLLTGDTAARLAAVTLGYRVHGTIGILVRSIRRGQRSRNDILSLLRAIPDQSTLHIRPRLLEEIIARIERE